jgi:SAM-dependent methyltransferase
MARLIGEAYVPIQDETARFDHIQAVLKYVEKTEHDYLLTGGDATVHTSFMPHQPADFLAIMSDCVASAQGGKFLDVGCGPGTKMLLAQEIFGLDVHGIELNPEMAAKANEQFPDRVITGDALNGDGLYTVQDIIWLYRPFKDGTKEDELERLIMHRMKPGAILVGGAWEMSDKPKGWHTVVDDWEIGRGAWKKPRNAG